MPPSFFYTEITRITEVHCPKTAQPRCTIQRGIVPHLQTFINSQGETNCYTLTRNLLDQIRENPEDSQLQQCWGYYFMNQTANLVTREYSRLYGFLRTYSVDHLYLLTFNQAYQQFMEEGRLQFKIPSEYMIKLHLTEVVRREFDNPYFGITDLGVAVRSSRRKWLGIELTTLLDYTLLWECLDKFKDSTDLSCHKWATNDFQEIADLYNSLRGEYPEITVTGDEPNIEDHNDLRNILNEIGNLIRNLDKPISGDTPISEETDITIIDRFSETESGETLLDSLEISEELESLYSNIDSIVIHLITNRRLIGFLMYALNYRQREIITITTLSHGTVAHFPGFLLKEFNKVLVSHLGGSVIDCTSDNLKLLGETMRGYYYSRIYNFCHADVIPPSPDHVNLIANTIMSHFKIKFSEPSERLQEIIIGILQNLI